MANYVEMWKDLGMDLENHDLLCQVLPTAVGDVFRKIVPMLWISGIWLSPKYTASVPRS